MYVLPLAVDAPTITLSAVLALVVAGVVSGAVKFFFDDRLAHRKAKRDETLTRAKASLDEDLARQKADLEDDLAARQASREFEFERRKALRNLISEFDGRLMEVAADFHFRLRNLYDAELPSKWLKASSPDDGGYFYRSTVYRFLALFRLAVGFDQKAIYFEPEACEKNDLRFIRYAKAFQWAMTDVRLFAGAEYDDERGADHFYRDELRSLSLVASPPDDPLTYFFFNEKIVNEPRYRPLFDFFAGLDPVATPLRWDRLVTLDLLLMGFLHDVGYADLYAQKPADFLSTASKLTDSVVRQNVPAWLSDLKLEPTSSVEMIRAAVEAPRAPQGRGDSGAAAPG